MPEQLPSIVPPMTPADPTNQIVGPYVPSQVQTGLQGALPVSIQMDTDTRLNRMFNPALSMKDIPTTNFGDFFNTQKQGKVPQVSLRDAFFSSDPKQRAAATGMLQDNKDTFAKSGAGNSITSPYDQAAKYLGKEFGYSALTDNEDLYARYKNSGFSGLAENVGKFIARTAGSAVLKLGEGISGLLAMPLAAAQDGHFWTNVSDNALVQFFDHAEKSFKDNWFPVYQSAQERGDGFFGRMFHDSTFWTSDFSDGLAFMLSAMLPGAGLSKIGLAAKMGDAAEILNYSRLGVAGKAMKFLSGSSALTAQGVDELAIGTLNTASEAFFEAKGVHDSVVQKYGAMLRDNPDQNVNLPDGSRKKASELSKDDIEQIAAHGAKWDFAANFPILMFSNAWETHLLYKAMGKTPIKAKGLGIDEMLKAEVEKPSSKIGKIINGPLGFYTKKSVEATWWEGLWEENAQLAAQRLNDDSVAYDKNDPAFVRFAKQIYKQTADAFSGKDQEAAESIGQGALMGLLAGNVISAASGERTKEHQAAIQAAARINNLRDNFLTGDIYKKGGDGQYVTGKDGRMVIDEQKLNAMAVRTNQVADKAKRGEDFKNPTLRGIESKLGFVDYFQAAILAGKDSDVLDRLESLKTKSPKQLVELGFDPEQAKADPQSFIDLGKQLQDLHDQAEATPMGDRPSHIAPIPFTEINLARRSQIFKHHAAGAIYDQYAQEAKDTMRHVMAKLSTPEIASASDQSVTDVNYLKVRQDQNQDVIENTQTSEKTRTNLWARNASLQKGIDRKVREGEMDKLKQDPGGYYHYQNAQLDKLLRASAIPDHLEHTASMENMRDSHLAEATNLSDPKKGFAYYTKDLENQINDIRKAPTPAPSPAGAAGEITTPTEAADKTAPGTTAVNTGPDGTIQPSATPTIQPAATALINNTPASSEQATPPVSPTEPGTGAPVETPAPEAVQGEVLNEDQLPEVQEPVAEEPVPPSPEDNTPPVQEEGQVEEANEDEIRKMQEQAQEEEGEEGKMIVNSLSIASKAVEYDHETGIAPRDEKGRPVFNSKQDDIIDSGKIVPGTTIYLKAEEISTDTNEDEAPIRIYIKENGSETNLGYLHTPRGARRLLTQNVDVDGEVAKLKQIRSTILASNGEEFQAQVTKTGFGFPNKGDSRGNVSINEATKGDSNAIFAVKKGPSFIGSKGDVFNTRFGANIKEGATVLLLPNTVNGQEVHIPVYVAKKAVSTDPRIADIVQQALAAYLTTGEEQKLSPARDYIYITNSPFIGLGLTNNGLFLNKEGNLIFRTKNIASMAMTELLQQLLVNVNTDKMSAAYVNEWRKSPSILTNFFARGEGDSKTYFHQHTIQFSTPVTNNPQYNGQSKQGRNENVQQKQPVLNEAVQDAGEQALRSTSTAEHARVLSDQEGQKVTPGDLIRGVTTSKGEETTDLPPSSNQAKAQVAIDEKVDLARQLRKEMEDDGFILDDIPESYEIAESGLETIAKQESALLVPGFNAFIQEDAINSVSQLLLSNQFKAEDMVSTILGNIPANKDRVKQELVQQLHKYEEKVQKYQVLIDQRDPQAIRIQQVATNLKLLVDNYDAVHQLAIERLDKIGISYDEQGYYQATEDTDDFTDYDDDKEYTRNNYASLAKQVKQFISFNSEKIEKDGNIGNRINSIGLPQIVQAASVYTKIINWLSEHYFAPTYEGFQNMMDKLDENPDPTIRDIAFRLRGASNKQLQFQFFAGMSKFKTNHVQQMVSSGKDGVSARNIDANSAQQAKVVTDQMSDEFLNTSKVLTKQQDEYGNTIYRVNKEEVAPYLLEFLHLSKDKKSYGIRRDGNGQPTAAKYLKEQASNRMYQILKDLGFSMSQKAFVKAVSSINSSNPKGDAQLGIQNLFTGGNKILRNMAEGDQYSDDRDMHNPFVINPTEMREIAKAEANFRNITQTDSFRSNGKSYYPFSRMSFVKSLFQQITDSAASGTMTPLLSSFLRDPFKSTSRFLARVRTDAKFSPSMEFARGAKETGTKGQNQEIKEMNDKDFVVSKLHAYQNMGNKEALFFSDTYSDKTTRFQVKADRENVKITFSGDKINVDSSTIDKFYNYFKGELQRVNQVRAHNEALPVEKRIANFHDLPEKEGIGKYFVVFNFLNKENLFRKTAEIIYDDNDAVRQTLDAKGKLQVTPEAIAAIKQLINDHLGRSILAYQKRLEKYGVFRDAEGNRSAKGINDLRYYSSVSKNFDAYWNTDQEITAVTADYWLNSALNSLEMLTLTGDPAQSPKVKPGRQGRIRLNDSIRATLTEASKRNASLNAPFDQGIAIQPTYKVGFIKDLKINSEQLALYKSLLPSLAEAVEAGYRNGDMTDAQEVTTVRQHLGNLLSLGRISPVEFIQAFAHFDPEEFDMQKTKQELAGVLEQLGITYTLDGNAIRKETTQKDMTGYLQVIKPVQRYSRWDPELGMVVETYIKTSSFPLVPTLVKGKDFEEVLRQMKENNIDRLNFSSGTKQGLINPQSLYNTNGSINSNLFTNNVITLDSAAWGEQGQNPEKEALKVTEGSQQQRMIFVDLPDEAKLTYKGQAITGQELRNKYVDDHKTILNTKLHDLFEELGIRSAGDINSFSSLGKLSDILQREGLDRNYDRNTLLSLGLNQTGQFQVPLTFLPNASEIQALLAAVISNRILKNKLPGTSLIQGSEMVIKTQGKVTVSADVTQAPKGSIVWTKPEHATINKLQYIRVEGNDVKPAQIVLPFYFKDKQGKSLKVSDYVNGQGFLDTSKIDPELLEINGFRIPYAGPNSGMWFEVVGYLPETMGSLVIVPAEVAAQMGADYDVDKLFTYVLNHSVGANGIRVDHSDARKQAENDIILAHKAIYLNKDRLSKTVEPTSTDELEGAVDRNLPRASTELTQIYDAGHQDDVWLSNRAGQLGVGISANFNTFHSLAQQSNLFVKGAGLKFMNVDGKVYAETNDNTQTDHALYGDIPSPDKYLYASGDKMVSALTAYGINRLDRINTFPNPYSGQVRPIASVINAWLQASVDNAKLQLLGAGGINKFNFNAALTIALHGFDSDWIIPFINQPILKEYYQSTQALNDKFNKDFSSDRKGNALRDLIDRWADGKLDPHFDLESYDGISHQDLRDTVGKDFEGVKNMGKKYLDQQLEILKQFLQLDKIGSQISSVSTGTKVEVKGLSKSFAEINQQSRDIAALEQSGIGNLHNLRTETVSGVYLGIPEMIDDLFNHPDNPIFAYSTPVYRYLGNAVQGVLGRAFNAEMLDDMYKDFKQFVYTHPSLGLQEGTTIGEVKERLLLKGDMVKLWQDMKARYPNSILLNQLSQQTKRRENDPDVITMQSAADDISTQIKQEWLDFFKSTDPQLVTLINQLTTYSLLFGSKEYGPSNMLKYIPFEVLKGLGFGERLNGINRQLTMDHREQYRNFIRQYVQHNHELARFVSNRAFPKNTLYQQIDGKKSNIPAQFTLDKASMIYLDKHPGLRSLATVGPAGLSWMLYSRSYVNDTIGHVLFELQNDGVTYKRIDTLGNQYINEYDFTNPDVHTVFPLKQAGQISDRVAEEAPAPRDNPNPTAQDITTTYREAKTVSDMLDLVQLRNGDRDDPTYQLHYQLAAALAPKMAAYTLDFSNGVTRGTTDHTRKEITINPEVIKGIAAKQNIPYEQALQQTLLHEATHAGLDQYLHEQSQLPASQQSAEYKQVTKVWNDYRKNLVNEGPSTYVRGIPDTFLEAELFKILYNRFGANRRGASYQADILSVDKSWDVIRMNKEEILSVIQDMQESMKQAYANHQISEGANFDFVRKGANGPEAIDPERVAQIVDYIDKNFQGRSKELKEKYYAYVSPQEFNTMTLTSPGFMSHLNSVQGSGQTTSLWEKFKDIVRKIISSFNNNSLLSDAIDAVLNINNARILEEVQDTLKELKEEEAPPWEVPTAEDPAKIETPVVASVEQTNPNAFTFKDGITVPTEHLNLNSQQREGLQTMADLVNAIMEGKTKDRLFMLSGFAGTGKSSTTKYLVKYLNQKYNGAITFGLATPTHKANKVLGRFFRGTINAEPKTTKSILGYKAERNPKTNKFDFVLDERKNKMPARGVMLIDEASFIGKREYDDILAAAAQKDATVIFMGDIAQIPSPDGSNQVSPAFGIKDSYQLTQVMRQADGNPLGPIYDKVRNSMMVKNFAEIFPHVTNVNEKGEGIRFISGDYRDQSKLLKAAIPAFQSAEFQTNKMAAKIVAYGNPTVEMYNREIRNAILTNPLEDFQVGELLMGYAQKQEMPQVQNGQDYVITDRHYDTAKRVREVDGDGKMQEHTVSGYELKLSEADEPIKRTETFMLNPKDLANQPFLDHYISLLEKIKPLRGADFYRVQEQIGSLEEQALIPETIYSYDGHGYTSSMLRQQFPGLFKFDEKTGTRAIDKMTSIEKNIDYGYAVTAHKVQGSTYKTVFIDENNLEFNNRIIKDTNGKDFSYERNNLLYVALSRPTTLAVLLSKHGKEENTHQTTPQETQETRAISQQIEQKTAQQQRVLPEAARKYLESKQDKDGMITIYRGVQGTGEKGTGQFWTTDKKVAEGYRDRYGIPNGQVVERKITLAEATRGFMGAEGNKGFAEGSDIFSLEPIPTGPTLNVSDTVVDKIRKGTKTVMNTAQLYREGTYFLKDGTKIQIVYQGDSAADQIDRHVYIGDPNNMAEMQKVPFDEYAKKEGYTSWAEFREQSKASRAFIDGEEPRYSYRINTIGKNSYDIAEQIQQLKDTNQLKQNC